MKKIIAFLREFRICARAIFAFGAGYKDGEQYELGKLEAVWARKKDPEAWDAGRDLAAKRYKAW